MLFADYKMRASIFRNRDSVRSRVSTQPAETANRNSIGGNMLERKSTQFFGLDSKFLKNSGSKKYKKLNNLIEYQEYTRKELSHDLKIDFYMFNQVIFFEIMLIRIVQTNL
jgi:hypothetical protein